ncbi:CapA family protein [Streptococcus saliviloxodontae]|uniref:Poly-gamma-glutamate synthesis protein (Capsule biosynthesis protein) n=1 Tax=Streptococcus saliviloxodontae TaxID=1349416 RepID=A0ABS2PMS9_9STRE|nr:CapA family protein [Streptococcus saliviloxodontae]MBM7636735.1 poly-gamma-glutamate synthesis protein (capsule biosynthesis protein) [Streptococcus saliviloxodontae]
MIATGDSLFSSRRLKHRLPEDITSLFQEADLSFTNAEFTTPTKSRPVAAGRGYVTSVRPDTLGEFQSLGINYVSFANNHSGDFGIEGIRDTLEAARQYGLTPLGIGESLFEARKPVFYDHPEGRLAFITIDVTRSEVFIASDAGNGVPARPGVNALRFESHYQLPEEAFRQLAEIDEKLGTRASMIHGNVIETFDPDNTSHFKFGSLFEKYVQIEKGPDYRVKTIANPSDKSENLKQIQDAKKRADYVIVSIHTHEGKNEDWYHDYPADFVEEFSREAIDSGADVIIGHGAHMTRGVEIYKEKPIFYNLGSLLMEFEAGESIIPPEMYEAYGYSRDAVPSDLHGNRVKDQSGNFIGFYSDPVFSQNLIAEIEFTDKINFRLLPIDLHLTHDQVTKRGLPTISDDTNKQYILERLNSISYHASFELKDGWIKLK